MLWIALHLHRLSLDIIERAQVSTRPLAICDHLQILCCNQAARDAGVHPGMRRATAQALSPGIELMAHDPVRDRQALASLACWALQFTPSVGFAPPPLPERRALRARSRRAMTPADDPSSDHHAVPAPSTPGLAGLLLEVAASLRLFGGPDGLLALLQAGLTELGYHANVGIAPTCHGAWLLARSRPEGPHRQPGATDNDAQRLAREHALDIACNPDHLPERLSCLPISLLEQAQSQQTALQAIGARTIGQLLQLPRAGLARRFGKALLLELDAALGVQAPLIGFFQAPDRFATRIELMADVDRTEPLLFAARHLITELTGWLTARQAGVRSFDLILEHNTLPRTSLSVRLTDASRDPQRLSGLLRERLNILQLRTSVHTLHLQCDRIQPLAATSEMLFAEHRMSTHEGLARLLERLQVRLGREQVQRLTVVPDHRPEAAYRIQVVDSLHDIGKAALQPHQAARAPQVEPGNPDPAAGPAELFCTHTGLLPRPLWLLREPMPLSERNNRPWLHSALTVLAGPERIETGWWDDHLVQRDYFVAEDDSNTLFWIYRERHQGWFVHGRFG